MPSTADRPDGSDDSFAVAEAAQVAARDTRETVPVNRPTEPVTVPPDRPTEPVTVPPDRPTEPVTVRRAAPEQEPDRAHPRQRETVLVDDRVLGSRETVKIPAPRQPSRPAGRAPLPVAVAFATVWAALL